MCCGRTSLTSITLQRVVSALQLAGLSFEAIASGQRAQELVYLMDRAGAGLGYRYRWDIFGPFSAELAEDLRDVDEETAEALAGDTAPEIRNAVARIQDVLEPAGNLSTDSWLRLVICVDFLEYRSRVSVDNGDAPPIVSRHFDHEQIQAAKDRVFGLAA
jgi:hypothetical protein